jgi:hypothetical protein
MHCERQRLRADRHGRQRLLRASVRTWYHRRELHLLVGVLVAAGTVIFASQRATDGVRAALDNRLLTAGADADAALVAVESEQLSAVREIAFTQGVAGRLAAHDGPGLNRLVAPLQANSTVPMIDVVLPNGRVLLAVRSQGAPAPVRSRAGLAGLTQSLQRTHGPRGGRLSELAVFRSGPTLVTISPIVRGSTPVGAVLAMTPLANVLGRLADEVGTEVSAYDGAGRPLATTATFQPKPVPADDARQLLAGGAVMTRYVYKDHREKLGRLIVDHTPNAVLGVSLEDDGNVTGRTVALYVLIGLLCTVVILGTFWARVELARRGGR